MALCGQPQQERHRLAGWVVRRPADDFRALACWASPELGVGVHHLGCVLVDVCFQVGVFGQQVLVYGTGRGEVRGQHVRQ